MICCSQEAICGICFNIIMASIIWIERVPLVGVMATGTINCTTYTIVITNSNLFRCSPEVYDLNRDGKKDLIAGESGGYV